MLTNIQVSPVYDDAGNVSFMMFQGTHVAVGDYKTAYKRLQALLDETTPVDARALWDRIRESGIAPNGHGIK